MEERECLFFALQILYDPFTRKPVPKVHKCSHTDRRTSWKAFVDSYIRRRGHIERKDIKSMENGKDLETQKDQAPKPRGPFSKFPHRWLLLIVVLCLFATAGLTYWWFFLRGRVTTEDAYVTADVASISSRISGSVLKVLVENDRKVKEGQALVELDPEPYQVAVDQAKAVVARMDAAIRAAEAGLSLLDRQTEDGVLAAQARLQQARDAEQSRSHQMDELKQKRGSAEADLTLAKKDLDRYESLYSQGSVSQQLRDNALTAFKKATAALKALDSDIEALKASVGEARNQVLEDEVGVRTAQSDRDKVVVERHQLESLRAQRLESEVQLQQAQLDLSYCTIKAPIAGVVAQKNVQVGNRVQPGQPVMAVVPLHAVYGEANFKETQLEHVRVGQPVAVEADIYPGYTFRGKVAGIRAGTGAAFSLLPPENATGNWIKVVQRVPVRIEFNHPLPEQYPLRIGLSLRVTVYIEKHSGFEGPETSPEGNKAF
jgi:membrane fusion protein (multidrug efflux system)